MQQYFPLILIALFIVVLFVLPARQRKRLQEKTQAMQNSLLPGTTVLTTSGMHARVAALGETTIDLEIAPGIVSTFERRAVLQVQPVAAEEGTGIALPPTGDEGSGATGATSS